MSGWGCGRIGWFMIWSVEGGRSGASRDAFPSGAWERQRPAGGGILFHALAGVDRSGRGCNPRPARIGGRSGASQDAFPSGAWERQGCRVTTEVGFFFKFGVWHN